jgi:hypothetical protein
MMGFDPAALNSLKTIGESDKDDVAKVRERALLALEGKTPSAKARNIPEIISNIGFAKVEIPEWKTPDVERTFDWGATTHSECLNVANHQSGSNISRLQDPSHFRSQST